MLVFNITQFFLSLNHQLIPLIFKKARFDLKISLFFSDYLVNRKTRYLWNSFTSSFFSVDVGIAQGSALSIILSTFFIILIFYIFEKRIKNLKISISFLLFVNDRLFISQERSFDNTNANLFYSYNIISSLLEQFGLIVKYRKTKNFHFSRLYRIFNILPLNLSQIDGLILYSKDTWQYLGFIFNRKLTFHQYIKFYANKALSIVKCIKMLENSML